MMCLRDTVLWVTLVICVLTLARSENASEDTSSTSAGKDPFWCRQQLGGVNLFEVFPGVGWDNLRNVEASQVAHYTFDQCKLTGDGRYLIPDNVFTVPLKTSHVDAFAELIDEWHNTSSLTARSININTGLSYHGVSISGSFSRETMNMKSKQIQDKAVTVRVKLQHNRYEAKLQPHYELTPQFRRSVMNLAARVELNHTEMARYEAQLLVRDFGTHVLTSVTAGAALIKDDYIKREFVGSQTTDKTSMLATASASFFGIFKIDTKISRSTSQSVSDAYTRSITDSRIRALGGPVLSSEDFSVTQWSDGIDTNLVAMDRSGDPIYFLVTPHRFPDLPAHTVAQVARHVRRAVEIYYEMNLISGCTRQGSPQFSPFANYDDGSCTAQTTNNTFGGVYQTCSVSGQYLNTNPCNGLTQVNPKTGTYSCPPSYTAVNIFQGSKLGPAESRRRCRRCGFLHLSRCCTTDNFQARANYQTYWCAATGPVQPESGYRFGGVYTSTSINLVTGLKTCPLNFNVHKLLSDLSICVSDDYELSAPFSIPFAGFFSCQEGNPLASYSGAQPWPSRCPEGFSQHLATVVTGCAFHYCVESGALRGPDLPPIKRPPFMLKPAVPMETAESFVMFNIESQSWMMNEEARNFLNETEPSRTAASTKNGGGSPISSSLLSVVFMVCTMWPMKGFLISDTSE